jgi:hypothetical protein
MRVLYAALAFLLSACASGEAGSSESAAAEASSLPTPDATVEATATPTPSTEPTPSPTAEAEPDVVLTASALLVPPDDGFDLLGFQIAGTIENRGTGWAKLLPFDSDWTVLDEGGGVTATGQMGQAYPQYLAPGATGYLVTYDVQSGADPADFVSVEIEPEFVPVDGPEVTFEFENTQVSYAGSYGLEGTGFVTADASREFAEIGLICLDADGRVLGVVNAQMMDTLEAGEREAFQTTGPPSQVEPDSCVTTIFEGTPHDFEF